MNTDDNRRDDPRARLAVAVRAFGHTSLRRDLDDATLTDLAADVEALLARVAEAPVRERDLVHLKHQFFPADLSDGQSVSHFEDCFVSGPHNPLGLGMQVAVDGDAVVAEVTLQHAHEGAPERAHGGIVAAVFDDVLGYLMSTNGIPAFTGELSVQYLAPTPIGQPLSFTSWMTDRAGRKIHTAASAHAADGGLVARASGVFIEVDPARFRAA